MLAAATNFGENFGAKEGGFFSFSTPMMIQGHKTGLLCIQSWELKCEENNDLGIRCEGRGAVIQYFKK